MCILLTLCQSRQHGNLPLDPVQIQISPFNCTQDNVFVTLVISVQYQARSVGPEAWTHLL